MYRQPKISKKQQPETSQFTIHNSHTLPDLAQARATRWTQGYYQIVSIDPGIENFTIRIERRHINGRHERILFERIKIPHVDTPMESDLYLNANRYLNQYQSHWKESHFFVMERQVPMNYKCVRISQHVMTYFLMILQDAPLLPFIVEIDSKAKSTVLGIPRGLTGHHNKNWLIEKALELSDWRGDQFSRDKILHERSNNGKKKKQDDLSDVICQAEALCKLFGMILTVQPK